MEKNVLGEELVLCCNDPVTGFFRDGFCRTNNQDSGLHVVCAVLTNEFLEFSKSRGNDLITARPEFGFPGLKEGDCWCLCLSRWLEAVDAGVAPKIILKATNARVLADVDFNILENYAYKKEKVEE